MKKIISLGIASAVLAMTAMSASAGVVVKTDDKVTTGATIKVTFVADADSDAISFKTTASGATLVDAAAAVSNPLVVVGSEKNSFVSLVAVKSGDVLFTQTYTVTAKEGEAVAVNVTDLEGTTGVATNLSVTVKTETSEPSTPSTSDPSTPSTSDPSTPSTSDPSTSSDTSKPDDDKNPGTGVALAVFPAVIAGAAVVVAKKKRG